MLAILLSKFKIKPDGVVQDGLRSLCDIRITAKIIPNTKPIKKANKVTFNVVEKPLDKYFQLSLFMKNRQNRKNW